MNVEPFDIAVRRLESAGWDVVLHEPWQERLPDSIQARYPAIPPAYALFLKRVARCVSPCQTVWFLCCEDFDGRSGTAFAWNEWEQQSLEQSKDSPFLARKTRSFWDDHLPFVTSVKSGYAYLALDLTTQKFGTVVAGYEPDLEDPDFVCITFEDWLSLLCEDLQKEPRERRFKHFS
jgi:hypothetical protein